MTAKKLDDLAAVRNLIQLYIDGRWWITSKPYGHTGWPGPLGPLG